jgi:hypothetical protein
MANFAVSVRAAMGEHQKPNRNHSACKESRLRSAFVVVFSQ